jgi:prepilin-type N-terminal cleavage/methylation domain-containing protein
MMKNRGVTLIELVIVIAIIGILVIALGFSYQGWMAKYKVERVTKDIYSDLMTARSMAINRNRAYFFDFPDARSYRLFGDTAALDDWTTDGDGEWDADGDGVLDEDVHTLIGGFPKTAEYDITWAEGTIIFDKRGIVEPSDNSLGGTICLFTDADPDYDCIVISRTRVNMGKIKSQGDECNATNCDAK